MMRAWEFLAALALFSMFAVLVIHWGDLPDRVPSHFNLAGEPDRWTGPYRLWFMPIFGALLYGVLTVLPRKGVRYNVPFGLDQSRPDVRSQVEEMLTVLKAVILVGFAALHIQVVMIAMGLLRSPGPWMVAGLVASTGVTVTIYLLRLSKLRGA